MALTPLRSGAGIVGKLFGSAVSSAVGFASGVAMGPVLAPAVRDIQNTVNSKYSYVFPDAGTLAEGVSQGQVPHDQAARWASYHGFGPAAFEALVAIANVGPGMAQAFNLWRRQQINEAGFRRALKRLGLEQEWIDALWKVREEIFDPAQLAAAIHRNLIPDPGLLKGEQPGPDRTVPAYPVYPIDALDEAHGSGYDRDHLGVLVGLQGYPMGPHEAAQAVFRGIITHDDYIAALNQGNTRNEWGDAIFKQTRQIPTARDFIENALRGYRSFDEAVAGAALHGMSAEHAAVIFQNSGRAMNLHQITQALAYGAKYNPTPDDNPDPYRQSTLVGPLRPEYYELNEALKYNLPTPLYFRTLQTQGVLSRDEAAMWYKRLGWPPDLAEQVATAFSKQKATAEKEATVSDLLTLYDGGHMTAPQALAAIEDLGYPADEARRKLDVVAARRVASARTTAISDLHAQFKKRDVSRPDAQRVLEQLELTPDDADEIVTRWGYALPQEGSALTLGGVKASYKAGTLDRATAVRDLEVLGLTEQAANVYLDT